MLNIDNMVVAHNTSHCLPFHWLWHITHPDSHHFIGCGTSTSRCLPFHFYLDSQPPHSLLFIFSLWSDLMYALWHFQAITPLYWNVLFFLSIRAGCLFCMSNEVKLPHDRAKTDHLDHLVSSIMPEHLPRWAEHWERGALLLL